jgi:hypothetical protein
MDNILRLTLGNKSQPLPAPASPPRSSLPGTRDWSSALAVVHQAAEAIRQTEERAREIEARSQALAERAVEELKMAEHRLQAAEAARRAAETRASEAEGRAREAEEWLMCLHDEILKQLIQRRAEPLKGTVAA